MMLETAIDPALFLAMLCELAPPAIRPVHRQVRDGVMTAVRGSATPQLCALTGRELEVALLVVEGKTTAQIADALAVSTSTVEIHRMHIGEKVDRGETPLALFLTREYWLRVGRTQGMAVPTEGM